MGDVAHLADAKCCVCAGPGARVRVELTLAFHPFLSGCGSVIPGVFVRGDAAKDRGDVELGRRKDPVFAGSDEGTGSLLQETLDVRTVAGIVARDEAPRGDVGIAAHDVLDLRAAGGDIPTTAERRGERGVVALSNRGERSPVFAAKVGVLQVSILALCWRCEIFTGLPAECIITAPRRVCRGAVLYNNHY